MAEEYLQRLFLPAFTAWRLEDPAVGDYHPQTNKRDSYGENSASPHMVEMRIHAHLLSPTDSAQIPTYPTPVV